MPTSKKKKPVSPQETLFRPGSVSKLFTWTAVMQLFEQGKVDLDRDVNEYLDYKIPDAFGKPITLKTPMTHTPGLKSRSKTCSPGNSPQPRSTENAHSGAHLSSRNCSCLFELRHRGGGYIVERISGRPFDEYVAENILKPLNMTHSTFAATAFRTCAFDVEWLSPGLGKRDRLKSSTHFPRVV